MKPQIETPGARVENERKETAAMATQVAAVDRWNSISGISAGGFMLPPGKSGSLTPVTIVIT